MMARFRGAQDLEADLGGFTNIVLYDDSSSGWEDASEKLEAAFTTLRGKGLSPVCVSGGFSAIENKFPYMWTSKVGILLTVDLGLKVTLIYRESAGRIRFRII